MAINTRAYLWAVIVSCAVIPDAAAAAEVRQDGSRWVLSNASLQRVIETEPFLQTATLTNKMTEPARKHPVESRGFRLSLDDKKLVLESKDFQVGTAKVEKTDAAATLIVPLANEEHGVKVSVTYWLGRDAFYVRKQLEIDPGAHVLNRVDVELFRLPGMDIKTFHTRRMPFPMNPWHINVGRPILAGDEIWLGVEHPASYNILDDQKWIVLRQHPGRKGKVRTDAAAMVFSADKPRERALDCFLRYVDLNRAQPIRRTVHWIEYFRSDYDDDFCREKFEVAERVFGKRNAPIDVVLMDSGWTEPQSIMKLNSRIPDRLKLISDLAREKLGAKLGLHVITSGVKRMVDKDWLAAEGYDMIYHKDKQRGAYCFADPRVYKEFCGNLAKYARQYGVAAYKFDWGHFECARAGHRGHLPGMPYGFEAGATNYQRLHRALREIDPDIFLFNTGWYSPYWLWTYDACFVAGGDYNFALRGPPSFDTGSLLCTYRDATVRGNIVRWSPFFPINSLMLVDPISFDWGTWKTRSECPLRALADYFMTACCRGCQMFEVYNNIPAWDEAQADAAAASLKWMRANDPIILADVRFIGGDPLRGKAYGYAHFLESGRGLIMVRNPTVEPRTIEIPFDETAGMWPSDNRFVLRQVYPHAIVLGETVGYGSTVSQRLASHEVRVFQVYPLDALPEPMPVGVRHQVIGRESDKTALKLTHVPSRLEIFSPVPISGAQPVAEKPNRYVIALQQTGQSPRLPRSTAGKPEVKDGRYCVSVDVAEGEQARVALLFRQRGVKGEMTVDGQPVAAMAPHIRLPDADRSRGPRAQAPDWSLFGIDLKPGKHRVCLKPSAAPKQAPVVVTDFRAEVSAEAGLELRHGALQREPAILPPQDWAWQARRVDLATFP